MKKIEIVEKLFVCVFGNGSTFSFTYRHGEAHNQWEFCAPNAQVRLFCDTLDELVDRTIVELASSAEESIGEVREFVATYERVRAELPRLEIPELAAILTPTMDVPR